MENTAVKNTDWFKLEGWMLNLDIDSAEELFLYAYIYSWTRSPKGYAFVWFECLEEWLFGMPKPDIVSLINALIDKGLIEVKKINDEDFGEEQVLVATNPFRQSEDRGI